MTDSTGQVSLLRSVETRDVIIIIIIFYYFKPSEKIPEGG